MNGQTRIRMYNIIAKRDGEYCRGCQVMPQERQLVLDHRDNNNTNNNLENLQLLCRTCNYLKNPRRPVDVCESERESQDLSELQVNRTKEPMFRQFVFHEVNERGEVSEQELVNSGAEHIGASPVTTKRYLDKLCSKFGLYEKKRVGKIIVIRFKKELQFT